MSHGHVKQVYADCGCVKAQCRCMGPHDIVKVPGSCGRHASQPAPAPTLTVDLDAPEHALCSEALARAKAERDRLRVERDAERARLDEAIAAMRVDAEPDCECPACAWLATYDRDRAAR
jgi:hypothetical protein